MTIDLNKVMQKRGPKCPKCKKPMILRTNSRDKSQFWGCQQYPTCNGTYSLEQAQKAMDREAQEALDNIQAQKEMNAVTTPLPKKPTLDDDLRALIAQRKKDSPW